MTKLQTNVQLKPHNTFRTESVAKYFIELTDKKDLHELKAIPEMQNIKHFVLGDGACIVFANDYDGVVLKMNIKGREIVYENEDYVVVRVGGGEDWPSFVTWAVENNYAGIENLAMIPGTVGAAPIQNIAAYGQNFGDTFDSLEAYDLQTDTFDYFGTTRCGFGYRTSVFKRELKDRYIITSVTFKLTKYVRKLETDYHERKGRYGSLESELQEFAKEPYSIQDVYTAVIRQRTKRLPSLEEFGTCGSYFINPTVTKEKFLELSQKLEDLQSYPAENLSYSRRDWDDVKDEYVKIPAARLIDELGWKGKWIGNVACSEKHALCIVTNKKATGKEILEYSNKVRQSVLDAYGIELESEVLTVE